MLALCIQPDRLLACRIDTDLTTGAELRVTDTAEHAIDTPLGFEAPTADADALTRASHRVLTQLAPSAGEPLLVALSDRLVLLAEVPTDTAGQTREAILYAAEEHLPADLEDLDTAVTQPDDRRHLVAAAPRWLTDAVLDIAAHHHLTLTAITTTDPLDNADPVERSNAPHASDASTSASFSSPRATGGSPASARTTPTTDPTAALLTIAQRIAIGKPPTIAFRAETLTHAQRARLLTRPLHLAGWLTLAALVLAAAGLLADAHRATTASTTDRQQQLAVYHDLLGPNAAPPADVLMRLQSEHRRLAGISGRATGRPTYRSALHTLRTVATHLPPDMRFNLDRIRISQTDLTLAGQARTHADAQQLQHALNAATTIDARPPRTKRIDLDHNHHGVSFTIVATQPQEATP